MMKGNFLPLFLIIIVCFLMFGDQFNTYVQGDGCYFVEKSQKIRLQGFPNFLGKLSEIYTLERDDDLPLWWIPRGVSFRRFRRLAGLMIMITGIPLFRNNLLYHLLILFFHISCAFLVYLIAKDIFRNRFIALFCAVVFSIHPSNYIAAVFGYDITFTYFLMLLSFFFFSKYRSSATKRPLIYLLSLGFFNLSLLSREGAVVLPFIIFFYDFAFKDFQSLRQKIRRQAPFFIILFVYLTYYFFTFRVPSQYYHSPFTTGFFVYILDNYIAHFSRLVLLYPLDNFLDAYLSKGGYSILPVAFLFLLAGIFILLLFRLKERRKYFFFLFWVLIGFTPTIWVLKYPAHFYVSSIGFSFFLGLVIKGIVDSSWTDLRIFKNTIALILALAVLAVYPFKIQAAKKEMLLIPDPVPEFRKDYPVFPDNSEIYFVNVPPSLCILAPRMRLEYTDSHFSVYVLSMKHPHKDREHYIERIDNNSFTVGIKGDYSYFANLWEKLYIWGRDCFLEGETVDMGDFKVTVSRVDRKGVKEIIVDLNQDLDDPKIFVFEYIEGDFIPVFKK